MIDLVVVGFEFPLCAFIVAVPGGWVSRRRSLKRVCLCLCSVFVDGPSACLGYYNSCVADIFEFGHLFFAY